MKTSIVMVGCPFCKFNILALILILTACSASAQTWHVNANGYTFTLSLATQGEKHVVYRENACAEKYDSVAVEGNYLSFRRLLNGATQWYRVEIADGIMVGRFAHLSGDKQPRPDLSAYKCHITGWSEEAFSITPVVFDINANGYRARLRVDGAGDNFTGRLKFYAFNDALREGLEEEITSIKWDGERLTFTRPGCNQVYCGDVNGAVISGTFTHAGKPYPWSGHRAEVLTNGLSGKTDQAEWRERTRRILYRLMMGRDPAPLSVNVEIVADDLPPIEGSFYSLRDDQPESHPQNYRLTELRLTYTLANWLGGPPIPRVVHAYLAKPTTAPPNGLEKYPLIVAVNGHGGSAWKAFDGGGLFYYGDAFARRGYMVLAVDISHRPLSDRLGYAEWSENGDDPDHGNISHPSIKPAGDKYYTDWEEDGERVWDVMRGIDYAVSRSDVDSSRIAVTGLSMGGEIASYVGALDPRVTLTIPSGFSPDLSVVDLHGNHGCWRWAWADIREYINHSDVLALIAPRPVIVETGAADTVFSNFLPPFAGDKQVIRRARVAGNPLLHFLHPLTHEYRTGEVRYTTVLEPLGPGDLTWQTNGQTATSGRTLFDYVAQFLNF